MKHLLILSFCLSLISFNNYGQSCEQHKYNKFIKEGNKAADKGELVIAYNKYNSAKLACPKNSTYAHNKMVVLLTRIEFRLKKCDLNNAAYKKIEKALKRMTNKYNNCKQETTKQSEAIRHKEELIETCKKDLKACEKECIDQDQMKVHLEEELKNLLLYGNLDSSFHKNVNFSSGLIKIKTTQYEYYITYDGQIHLIETAISNINEEITALELKDQKLSIIPKAINEHKRLRILSLSNNNLTIIPKFLKSLKKLEYLDLSYNAVNGLDPVISRLDNLVSLDLNHNNLLVFPKIMKRLENLQFLDLSHNQLSWIPSELEDLDKLQFLNLSYNKLLWLPSELEELDELQFLDLKNNELEDLPSKIDNLDKLQFLDLRNNKISEKEKERINNALPNCIILF